MIVTATQQPVLSGYGLNRKIQRNVEQFVLALRPDGSDQTHVIFHVLKHIKHQQQIKERIAFVATDIIIPKALCFSLAQGF